MSSPGGGTKIPLTFDPKLSDEALATLRTQIEDLIDLIAKADKEVLDLGRDLAKSAGLGIPANPAAAGRVLRSVAAPLTAARGIRNPSLEDIYNSMDSGFPEPARKLAAKMKAQQDLDDTYREKKRKFRQVQEEDAAYRKSPAGRADIFRTSIFNRRTSGEQQAAIEEEEYNTPEGKETHMKEAGRRELRSQRRNMASRIVRPELRRQAAKEFGITLPEDMNPFAKALQDTFKSAASVGMLEALSGGSAAPLARAFASNIIAGALMPAALQGLSKIGGAASNAAGSALGSIFSRGAASTVATDAAGGAEGAIASSATAVGVGGAGLLSAVAPLAAVAALGALLAGGAALYASAANTEQSTMAEQGAAAIGGPGWSGKNNLFNRAALDMSKGYMFPQEQMAAVGVGLGNMGIQGGQPIRSGMANAAILARLTGNHDPTAFTQLVGSLGTTGGMSQDDISKMIGLLAKQNELTTQNRVPLDTMVGNLQQLVAATGGLPVNAAGVAGLTAITNKFNNMGKQGQAVAQQVGTLMAPLMGATGATAIMAQSMLGMTPDQFKQAQSNPVGLFNKLSQFVQQTTSGTKGYARQEEAQLLISNFPQLFGGNLGSANTETLARALLGNTPGKQTALTSKAEDILAMTPTDANAVKRLGGKLADVQTSKWDQGMLAATNVIRDHAIENSTSLHQIVGLLGRSTGQWSGSSNPAIMQYEVAHGGPPTLVNGKMTNPDGSPYKGPALGGGYTPDHPQPGALGNAVTGWNLGSKKQVLVPGKYAGIINGAASTYGIDPRLIAAVMRDESGFDPTAVSSAGARGLMQLMPGTFQDVINKAGNYPNTPLANLAKAGIMDPAANIYAGAQYIKMIEQSGVSPTDYYTIGAKYNGGIGAGTQNNPYYPQSMQEGTNVQAWATSEQTASIGLTGTLTLISPTGQVLGTGTIKAQGSHS